MLSLNGKPYGVGDAGYMTELFNDYVKDSGMYGRESAAFVVERMPRVANQHYEQIIEQSKKEALP